MKNTFRIATILCLLNLIGCSNSADKITFPAHPLAHTTDADWYDVNHDGKADFGVLPLAIGKEACVPTVDPTEIGVAV